MLAVIKSYLQANHPSIGLWDEETGILGMRLTDDLRRDIQDASRGGQLWIDRSRKGRLFITTQGDIAFRHPDVELINVSHPLLKAAVAAVGEQLEDAVSRVGQAVVTLDTDEDRELDEGTYFVVVFTHQVEGIRARRILETIAWAEDPGDLLDSEVSERLMHLVVQNGVEWDRSDDGHAMPITVWKRIVTEARTRNRQLLDREKRENEARYARRKRVLEAEYHHGRQLKSTRLETARARGRDERVLRAFQGQLDKADSDYRDRLNNLEETRDVSARLSQPVAACLVEIRRL